MMPSPFLEPPVQAEADRTAAETAEGRRPPAASPPQPRSGLERAVIGQLNRLIGSPPLRIAVAQRPLTDNWTNTDLPAILIRDYQTLRQLLRDPLFQFGEAYVDQRLHIEGDLVAVLVQLYRTQPRCSRPSRSWNRLFRWLNVGNTRADAKKNIHHHYDIGNDFYRLWLDKELVYTCAYFPQFPCELEQAQQAKMELVCRKLRLLPGETVVEAGCGWGALARYMARHYGVRVYAYNISREQLADARQQAVAAGLDQQVTYIEGDWRDIRQSCDAFVSVGMLEHVGSRNYHQLGGVIDRCLKPEGRGLIHSIGQTHSIPLNPWIERRIFPGAYPPTISQMMEIFQPHHFAVLDLENLRRHYAETLRHWLERFELAADQVGQMYDSRFVRMWRLYLAGSLASFETGYLHLFQVVFSREANNQVPWTRGDLFAQPFLDG